MSSSPTERETRKWRADLAESIILRSVQVGTSLVECKFRVPQHSRPVPAPRSGASQGSTLVSKEDVLFTVPTFQAQKHSFTRI